MGYLEVLCVCFPFASGHAIAVSEWVSECHLIQKHKLSAFLLALALAKQLGGSHSANCGDLGIAPCHMSYEDFVSF